MNLAPATLAFNYPRPPKDKDDMLRWQRDFQAAMEQFVQEVALFKHQMLRICPVKLDSTGRDALVKPQVATIIWNTDTPGLEVYDGASWNAI